MRTHVARGNEANTSGNSDQARAEWGTAADMLASFADQFPSSDWRIVARYEAARYDLFAQRWEQAAVNAEKIVDDPQANAVSKAMASHLAAAAWQNLAITQVKAGKLEPIKLLPADQRKEPPSPRPPPGPWKRFVEATDKYVQVAGSDPDAAKPPKERFIEKGPAQLALLAAEVEYAFDDMEDARGRFDKIIHTWTGDPDVMEQAIPLYLQTFLVLKDQAGYAQAVQNVRTVVADEVAKANQAGDASKKEALAKVQDQLKKYEQNAQYGEAKSLLDQGKFAEAAQRFEALAQANKGSEAAAGALNNAAYAWNKAERPDDALRAVETLLADYPSSAVSPDATLMLAGLRSKKNDHAAAAKAYLDYLEKWPQGDKRCIALQNVGYELDVSGKAVPAAERYVAFANDPKCGKDDPNATAKALVRAGKLFADAKQKAKAREALEAATKVEGVTDVVAQSQIREAKRMLKQK